MQQYVAKIVAAYLRSNPTAPEQVGEVIAIVDAAFSQVAVSEASRISGLRQNAIPDDALQQPAVPIEDAVYIDRVICLNCGKSGKTIKEHIRSVHGMTPVEYRQRWGLAFDHPLVAPATSYLMRDAQDQRRRGKKYPYAVEQDETLSA